LGRILGVLMIVCGVLCMTELSHPFSGLDVFRRARAGREADPRRRVSSPSA